MIVNVHSFKTGEVAKLATLIEQHSGDLFVDWVEGAGWIARIEIVGKGSVYVHRPEDIRRLAEFMRGRAPGNKESFVELFNSIFALADLVDAKRASGELPPNLLAIMHPQGSA